jgi:virulence plasmid B protein
MGVAPQTSVAQTMSLPGKFDVNAGGAATYAIPIAVPPGTADMHPALTLEYSSQSANGIVGVGGALGGLPAVTRCPQTMAQDGVRGSVNFDANDRFCLDGQRLMAISGAYAADGTEYRTEIESFARVISHGAAGTGPAWFEVHTKSGQIMEFGHTASSQLLAQGKTTARVWAVNKVADTAGNYYTVSYTNDPANGQDYPIEIDYSGNAAAGVSPYNKVQFAYTTRPDIVPLYQAGSLTRVTVLLSEIKAYAGSTLVNDYKLAYQQGTATQRSRLASVTLCYGDGTCQPPTTFAWQEGVSGFSTSSWASRSPKPAPLYPLDINGDGKTDFIQQPVNSSTKNPVPNGLTIYISNGDGTFSVSSVDMTSCVYCLFPVIADLNGDGKSP